MSYITERKVVDDVSFKVKKGEVVGIYGLMGSGRTEISHVPFWPGLRKQYFRNNHQKWRGIKSWILYLKQLPMEYLT